MSTAATPRRGRRVAKTAPVGKDQHLIADAATMAAGLQAEQDLAAEAAELRGDDTELTPALLMKLTPLLRRPVPAGFIAQIGETTGKPYASTGIRSVQFSIDRMDAVLTPLWWREDVEYMSEGKLAEVTIEIGNVGQPPMVVRRARGGVNRGSTEGNLFKGTYTNAAKIAFARVGVGHEVYLGMADFDPDTDPAAAREQGKEPVPPASVGGARGEGQPIGPKKGGELADIAWRIGCDEQLPLALAHVTGDDPGDVTNKTAASAVLARLTQVEAAKVETWLNRKADEATAAADSKESTDA